KLSPAHIPYTESVKFTTGNRNVYMRAKKVPTSEINPILIAVSSSSLLIIEETVPIAAAPQLPVQKPNKSAIFSLPLNNLLIKTSINTLNKIKKIQQRSINKASVAMIYKFSFSPYNIIATRSNFFETNVMPPLNGSGYPIEFR